MQKKIQFSGGAIATTLSLAALLSDFAIGEQNTYYLGHWLLPISLTQLLLSVAILIPIRGLRSSTAIALVVLGLVAIAMSIWLATSIGLWSHWEMWALVFSTATASATGLWRSPVLVQVAE